MSTRKWIVVILAALAAFSQAITVIAAWCDIKNAQRRATKMTSAPQLSAVRRTLRRRVQAISAYQTEELTAAVVGSWQPGAFSVRAVIWCAPIGIILGLAATLVGVM